MSKGNRTRRKALGLLPEAKLCAARTRSGVPCKRSPIKGAVVCRAHGGAAPQVQARARERLALASENMVVLLQRIATDEKEPVAVRLAAIKDVLDRAGVSAKTVVSLETELWQDVIADILAEAPTEDAAPQLPAGRSGQPVIEASYTVSDEDLSRPVGGDPDPSPGPRRQPPPPPPVAEPVVHDYSERNPPGYVAPRSRRRGARSRP